MKDHKKTVHYDQCKKYASKESQLENHGEVAHQLECDQ